VTIFRYVAPCSLVKFTDVSDERTTSLVYLAYSLNLKTGLGHSSETQGGLVTKYTLSYSRRHTLRYLQLSAPSRHHSVNFVKMSKGIFFVTLPLKTQWSHVQPALALK
jgi:hypothetical protein